MASAISVTIAMNIPRIVEAVSGAVEYRLAKGARCLAVSGDSQMHASLTKLKTGDGLMIKVFRQGQVVTLSAQAIR